ncbi:MAG: hypothetical protein IJ963_00775 [Phascolarctobacterium sp.]|nr:hypothetical protein [Phascolarctobacterium sp.]
MGFWSTIGDIFSEGINEGIREAKAPEKVEEFNGTDAMYAAKQNRYWYEDRDWLKAFEFEAFVAEKYPGRTFENDYSMVMSSMVLYNGYQVQQLGLIQYIRVIANEPDSAKNTLIEFLDFISMLVAMGSFMEIYGLSHYNFSAFVYSYLKDANEIDRLYKKYERADYDEAEKLERKMDDLSNKYDGWLGFYPYYIKSLIEFGDVDHIPSNIQQSAAKYSKFMDEVYSHVLSNAIRLHNAHYLRNLYPTEAQKAAVRGHIQQEIGNKLSSGLTNINVHNRYAGECLKICSRMFELENQNSGSNLMAKGALALALGFISGPLGVASGIREGYNVYARENDLEALNERLAESGEKLIEEYFSLGASLINATQQLGDSLNKNVCKTYLYSAISDIFNRIQQNGDRLYPVVEYFK